jgi:hypothetical protein
LSVQRLGCPLRDLAVATDRGADSADDYTGMAALAIFLSTTARFIMLVYYD